MKHKRSLKKSSLKSSHSPYVSYTNTPQEIDTTSAGNTSPEQNILIPELRDKYELISVLGRGNQGSVYLARAKSDKSLVAIKQITIDSVSSWKTYDLFHREVDTLSKLDIPGIARFYEAAEHLSDDHPAACIVQQYIEGHTLSEMIRLGHRFSLSRIFEIAYQLIEILQALHGHQPPIIHRDIKPSNIILTPNNTGYKATLIDFGAVANPQIQSGGSTVAGTYGYMPPEQITGHPEPASDIYALGVMLVSLIAGVSPDQIEVKDFRLIIDPLLENVPPQIVPVLRQMTDPLVANRLTDYNKLKSIFKSFSNSIFEIPDLLPVKALPPDEFNQKLKNVTDLGQPGNIELWQQLGDSTNRAIPELYKNLKIRSITETRPIGPVRNFFTKNPISYLIAVPVFLFLVIYYGFGLYGYLPGYLFFLTLPMIAFACMFISSHAYAKRHNAIKDMYQNRFDQSLVQDGDKYIKLLTSGRRSMATVIDAEYISPDFSEFEKIGAFQYACKVPPEYHIRYKFNPPDDDNPNDLIRTYISSKPPQLQPGDTIPILYNINRDEHNHITDVTSMPFPIPLQDVATIDRIISSKDS